MFFDPTNDVRVPMWRRGRSIKPRATLFLRTHISLARVRAPYRRFATCLGSWQRSSKQSLV